MVEIVKYGNFKAGGKQQKKKQIILTHTSRKVQNYLQSLKYRFNGKYNKIPNFVITKDGRILQLLENYEHTNYFSEPNINRNGIIISLENLGWLQKEPLKDFYINWIGDIYDGIPFERKWRDYFFWDPYTENQITSLVGLTKNLFKEMKIESNIIGYNTKINGVERYEGLVTRSNFDVNFTDVSPAFNFEKLIKKIENE
jgi:N-acetyl-anhydromuramyl-L-alanine amidase AmpD